MSTPKVSEDRIKQVVEVFNRHAGNMSATARELGCDRKTVRRL
jgi:ActR/RegA family two-component response regulator